MRKEKTTPRPRLDKAEAEVFFGARTYARLLCFTDELIKWNRKFSLTSVEDSEIFDRLVAPSAWLGLAYAIEKIVVIADFGTGAGIPGIPMALVDGRNRYLLIDSNHKKIGFIKHLISIPGLLNTDMVTARALRFPSSEELGRVDRVVSRGSGSLERVVELWSGRVSETCKFDFFKGTLSDEEVGALMQAHPSSIVTRLDTPEWFGELQIFRVEGSLT